MNFKFRQVREEPAVCPALQTSRTMDTALRSSIGNDRVDRLRKADADDVIHHIAVLSGLVLSYICGGFTNVYICLNGILETVGPVYNIMKCLPAHAHILRLIAIFVNMCVRFPYFIWVFRLMVLCRGSRSIGQRTSYGLRSRLVDIGTDHREP